MKTYKDLAVPPGVDRNLETLRAVLSKGVKGCIFNETDCTTVGRIGCTCVACSNCICDHSHRDVLKEYLNKAEKESSTMREQLKKILKPGMVIRTVDGRCHLWVGGGRNESYRLRLFEAPECSFNHIILDDDDADFDFDLSEVVFSDGCPGAPSVRRAALYAILEGRTPDFTIEVWKRPEPVKEMTVDEISKALGYKVKVVGNEKADD